MARFGAKPPKDRCIVHPCPHDLNFSDLLQARPVVLDRALLEDRRRRIMQDTGSKQNAMILSPREAREVRAL